MKNYTDHSPAFTLLEVIVSLSITSLCFMLISWSVQTLNQAHTNRTQDKQVEWHLFLNQMDYYLEESDLRAIGLDRFQVTEYRDGQTNVEYLQVNDKFIRRVRGGTQPLLLDLLVIRFYRQGDSLEIQATFKNGEVYHATIWVESWE